MCTIISKLNHAGLDVFDIAKCLNQLKSAISNSLKSPLSDNTSRRKGKAAKVSPRTKRLLFEMASQGKLSASNLVSELDLPIGKRRVQQLLQKNPNF
jgi:hypothetical protein